PRNLTELNGIVYFSALDGEQDHGYELWRSDGSPQGTWLVKDIFPGPSGSDPRLFTTWNGTLFFTAYWNEPPSGVAIWRSDGTDAGTIKISHDPFWGGRSTWMPGEFESAGDLLYYTDTLRLGATDGSEA